MNGYNRRTVSLPREQSPLGDKFWVVPQEGIGPNFEETNLFCVTNGRELICRDCRKSWANCIAYFLNHNIEATEHMESWDNEA